jgi:hypothetical protein
MQVNDWQTTEESLREIAARHHPPPRPRRPRLGKSDENDSNCLEVRSDTVLSGPLGLTAAADATPYSATPARPRASTPDS